MKDCGTPRIESAEELVKVQFRVSEDLQTRFLVHRIGDEPIAETLARLIRLAIANDWRDWPEAEPGGAIVRYVALPTAAIDWLESCAPGDLLSESAKRCLQAAAAQPKLKPIDGPYTLLRQLNLRFSEAQKMEPIFLADVFDSFRDETSPGLISAMLHELKTDRRIRLVRAEPGDRSVLIHPNPKIRKNYRYDRLIVIS